MLSPALLRDATSQLPICYHTFCSLVTEKEYVFVFSTHLGKPKQQTTKNHMQKLLSGDKLREVYGDFEKYLSTRVNSGT